MDPRTDSVPVTPLTAKQVIETVKNGVRQLVRLHSGSSFAPPEIGNARFYLTQFIQDANEKEVLLILHMIRLYMKDVVPDRPKI